MIINGDTKRMSMGSTAVIIMLLKQNKKQTFEYATNRKKNRFYMWKKDEKMTYMCIV